MIISHKHKFIFMKTRKTAGSSIQVALSRICGNDDIITGSNDHPLTGFIDESHHAGVNMNNFFTNHPHPKISDVKKFVGNDIWKSYFKFAFVRNPYDIAVSRYHWNNRDNPGKSSIEGFRKWTEDKIPDHDILYQYTHIDGKCELDFVGYYENLLEDFDTICKKIGIETPQLGFQKNNYRNKNQKFRDFYDVHSENRVRSKFSEDIELFGYNELHKKFLVRRISPIITKNLFKNRDGDNINGASIIKVPDWVENPLGKYYLYFAHHLGKYIRMAYSDKIDGEYKLYEPGTLKLENTICLKHIASPDVHVDNENKKILMYYHGDYPKDNQHSFVAFSDNGLDFSSNSEILGKFYFRVFKYGGKFYSIAKNDNSGMIIYESDNGISDFKPIYTLENNMRHYGLLLEEDNLHVFTSLVHSEQEQIYCYTLDLKHWDYTEVESIIKPETDYEGANIPKTKSEYGAAFSPQNQLRDPYVYKENDKLYLLYSIKGEQGIAIARLIKLKD